MAQAVIGDSASESLCLDSPDGEFGPGVCGKVVVAVFVHGDRIACEKSVEVAVNCFGVDGQAVPAFDQDIFCTRRRKRGTQIGHGCLVVAALGGSIGLVLPKRRTCLATRYARSAAIDQKRHQLLCFRTLERERLAVDFHFEAAEGARLYARMGVRVPFVDEGELAAKFFRVDGLEQVSRCVEGESVECVILEARHEYDVDFGMQVFEAFGEGEAVYTRHLDITERDVDRMRSGVIEGFDGGRGSSEGCNRPPRLRSLG